MQIDFSCHGQLLLKYCNVLSISLCFVPTYLFIPSRNDENTNTFDKSQCWLPFQSCNLSVSQKKRSRFCSIALQLRKISKRVCGVFCFVWVGLGFFVCFLLFFFNNQKSPFLTFQWGKRKDSGKRRCQSWWRSMKFRIYFVDYIYEKYSGYIVLSKIFLLQIDPYQFS